MLPVSHPSRTPGPRAGRAAAALAAVVAVTALAGCGGTSSAAEPGTLASGAVSAAAPRPSDGAGSRGPTQSLGWYGFTHAPAGVVLPRGLSVVYRIDQPNVVTAFFPASDGPRLAAWLAEQLPTMGYRVEGASVDSVVFSGSTWSGAFTSDSQVSALTLRRN